MHAQLYYHFFSLIFLNRQLPYIIQDSMCYYCFTVEDLDEEDLRQEASPSSPAMVNIAMSVTHNSGYPAYNLVDPDGKTANVSLSQWLLLVRVKSNMIFVDDVQALFHAYAQINVPALGLTRVRQISFPVHQPRFKHLCMCFVTTYQTLSIDLHRQMLFSDINTTCVRDDSRWDIAFMHQHMQLAIHFWMHLLTKIRHCESYIHAIRPNLHCTHGGYH